MSSDSEDFQDNEEEVGVCGYLFEPVREQDADIGEEDIVARLSREEVIAEFKDTTRWCQCGKCKAMPTREQNRCCRSTNAVKPWITGELRCLTDHAWCEQLLQDGPLAIEYNRFLHNHDEMFPQNPTEKEMLAKKRFCSYRSMIFWLYPKVKRRECHPLPACIYSYIQSKFKPTDNEEEFADWQFVAYMP